MQLLWSLSRNAKRRAQDKEKNNYEGKGKKRDQPAAVWPTLRLRHALSLDFQQELSLPATSNPVDKREKSVWFMGVDDGEEFISATWLFVKVAKFWKRIMSSAGS